jgi:hypothetical protein
MNATTEPVILDLEPIGEEPKQDQPASTALALSENSPAGVMMRALERGATPEQIGQMMALQREWDADQARKAYNAAFAAFKAEAVHIVKNRQVTDGPLKGKSYAELHAVVDALTPALSRHGLSASWRLTKDEKDWMEVTCYLRHVNGHEESVSMGGPPDAGAAKNAIQARASTKSYLERYTLKAICGVAEGGDDDDGNAAGNALLSTWVDLVNGAESQEALTKVSREGAQAFTKAKDVEGYRRFASEVRRRTNELKEAVHG